MLGKFRRPNYNIISNFKLSITNSKLILKITIMKNLKTHKYSKAMSHIIINRNMTTTKIAKNFLIKITIDSLMMLIKINQIRFHHLIMKNPFRQLIFLHSSQMQDLINNPFNKRTKILIIKVLIFLLIMLSLNKVIIWRGNVMMIFLGSNNNIKIFLTKINLIQLTRYNLLLSSKKNNSNDLGSQEKTGVNQ